MKELLKVFVGMSILPSKIIICLDFKISINNRISTHLYICIGRFNQALNRVGPRGFGFGATFRV